VIIPVLVTRSTVIQSLCPSAGSAGCHIHRRCCYGLAFARLSVPGRRGSPGDGPGLHPPVPLFVVDSPRLDGKSTFLCSPPPYVRDTKIHCRKKRKEKKRKEKENQSGITIRCEVSPSALPCSRFPFMQHGGLLPLLR
jgi:hypothetical protein